MRTLTVEDHEVGEIITALAMTKVPLIAKISAQVAAQQRAAKDPGGGEARRPNGPDNDKASQEIRERIDQIERDLKS